MDKCATCVFFDHSGASSGAGAASWGQCRRSSPMLHPVNVKSYMIEGVWPHVRDDDWCGQWMSPARAARADSTHAVQPARAATEGPTARAPAVAPHPRPAVLTPVPASASVAAAAAPATKAMHAGD